MGKIITQSLRAQKCVFLDFHEGKKSLQSLIFMTIYFQSNELRIYSAASDTKYMKFISESHIQIYKHIQCCL